MRRETTHITPFPTTHHLSAEFPLPPSRHCRLLACSAFHRAGCEKEARTACCLVPTLSRMTAATRRYSRSTSPSPRPLLLREEKKRSGRQSGGVVSERCPRTAPMGLGSLAQSARLHFKRTCTSLDQPVRCRYSPGHGLGHGGHAPLLAGHSMRDDGKSTAPSHSVWERDSLFLFNSAG